MLNYTYIVPIIYNNIYIRCKRLQDFIIKNKLKYGNFFLLTGRNVDRFFNSYDFYKINLSIYNLYSNFIVYKLLLC